MDYDNNAQSGKGRQTFMLVLLLVLLGGFAYLYFFTGLIRPQEPTAENPPPAQTATKMPLPARDGSQQPQPAATPAATPVPATAPVPVPAATPAPAPVAAAKPQAAPAPQPAPAPVKKAEPKAAAKTEAAPAEKRVAAVKPEEKKAAAPAAKPAVAPAVKPAAPVKEPVASAPEEKKPAAVKKAAKPMPADSDKATMQGKPSGPWTLVVGNYVIEEALVADIAKVKGAGLNPVITAGQRKTTAMNRLFFAEFNDKQAALEAVENMKKLAASPFSVQKGTKYQVFAGSFAMAGRAESERQRLAAAGVKVSIQKVQTSLPSKKLTAGTFTDRKAADAALKKLKAAGVGAPVLD